MTEAIDDLAWLQGWYAAQCNGDWEHQWGVKVGTLDNPGWSVTVDLRETKLAGLADRELKSNYDDETAWIVCKISKLKFEGHGGPNQLASIIGIFRKWATEPTPSTE